MSIPAPARPDDALPPAAPAGRLAAWAVTAGGRAARSGVITLLAVALAVAAHVASTAPSPSLPVVSVGFLLTWRVGWGLAGARVTRKRLLGLVVAVQFCFHVAFAVAAPVGHHHPGAGAGGARAGPAGAESVDLLHGGPTALVAHLLAAVALAWWLATGERFLWRAGRGAAAVASLVVRRLRHHLAPPAPLPGVAPAPAVPFFPAAAAHRELLFCSLSLRGPPLAPAG